MDVSQHPFSFIDSRNFYYNQSSLLRKPIDPRYVKAALANPSSNSKFLGGVVIIGLILVALVCGGFFLGIGAYNFQMSHLNTKIRLVNNTSGKDSVLMTVQQGYRYLGGKFTTESEIGDCKGVIAITKLDHNLIRVENYSSFKKRSNSDWKKRIDKSLTGFRAMREAMNRAPYFFEVEDSGWDKIYKLADNQTVFFKYAWGLKQFPPDGIDIGAQKNNCE